MSARASSSKRSSSVAAGELGRVVVVSPHCDDAALGCGELLATYVGAVVITVFAGSPPAPAPLTPWDEAAGFQAGDDVAAARREEDREALDVLGARPVWLDFRDAQYGPSPAPAEVAEPLAAAVLAARPSAVFIPLGLFHSDHALAHEAGLLVLRRHPGLRWFAYEEAIYRRFPGDVVGERIRRLHVEGLAPRRVSIPLAAAGERKRKAIECYRSQLRALSASWGPGYADAFAEETFWRLTSRP